MWLWIALLWSALAQEVTTSLDGVTVTDQLVPYDTEIELLADCTHTGRQRWGFGEAALSARTIGDHELQDANVTIWAYGTPATRLREGRTYRLVGTVRDGSTFDGRSQLLVDVRRAKDRGAFSPPAEVDLDSKVGEVVELTGRLRSLNGVWWFVRGDDDLYVTDSRGRSLTFPSPWHWRTVRVRGELRKQERASLSQISLKNARDLATYFVVVDADVELEDPGGFEDEGARMRVLYPRTPKKVASTSWWPRNRWDIESETRPPPSTMRVETDLTSEALWTRPPPRRSTSWPSVWSRKRMSACNRSMPASSLHGTTSEDGTS